MQTVLKLTFETDVKQFLIEITKYLRNLFKRQEVAKTLLFAQYHLLLIVGRHLCMSCSMVTFFSEQLVVLMK